MAIALVESQFGPTSTQNLNFLSFLLIFWPPDAQNIESFRKSFNFESRTSQTDHIQVHFINHTVLFDISCLILSSHMISYHMLSYHMISYHMISYHMISYDIISYRITWPHMINIFIWVLSMCMYIYIYIYVEYV